MSPAVQRALFLLGGVAIGGALVMATLRFAKNEPQVSYARVPLANSNVPNRTAPPIDKKEPHAGTRATEPKKDEDAKWDPTKQPFNPFDVRIGPPMPAKEITGHIEQGPMDSKTPGGNQKPSSPVDPPETVTPKGLLVTMRLDVGDPDAAVKALQGIASKVGGSAIRFDESAANSDAEGAIVFVSTDKCEEAAKLIESVGSIVVSDKWTGSSLDRIDRIERLAADRLSDLRMKRQELLIKYFEDAPEVKHLDEDVDRISKCVAALRARKPGPNTAVIKIKFLT
jgi:hypothetical protein